MTGRPPMHPPAAHPAAAPGDRFARWVVGITGTLVVGACMAFSFGNVVKLGQHLGVPGFVAYLVAPAVDLTVIGLVVGIRHLSRHGAPDAELAPARWMLKAAGLAMWALNTAYPLFVERSLGAVAYDSVAPLLLYGWCEVGPWFLRRFRTLTPQAAPATERQPDPAPASSAAPRPTVTPAAPAAPGEAPPTPHPAATPAAPPAGERRPDAAPTHAPTTTRPAAAGEPSERDERERAARHARTVLAREGRPPGRRRLARDAGVTEHAARMALADLPAMDAPHPNGDQPTPPATATEVRA